MTKNIPSVRLFSFFYYLFILLFQILILFFTGGIGDYPLRELTFQIFFLVTKSSYWLLAAPAFRGAGWTWAEAQGGGTAAGRAAGTAGGGTAAPWPRAAGQRPSGGGAVSTARRPFVSARCQAGFSFPPSLVREMDLIPTPRL